MKKKTLLILILFVVVGLIITYYCIRDTTGKPKRAANVPSNATWVGGVDGGVWFLISKTLSTKEFRIKIYNDFTGDMEVDTAFVLDSACSFKEFDSTTLINDLDAYDGKKVLLKSVVGGKNCTLLPK